MNLRRPSRGTLGGMLLGILLFGAISACSTVDSEPARTPELVALPAVSDLAVGSNRFAFALLLPDGTQVQDAAVDVRLFAVENGLATLRETTTADYIEVTIDTPHIHDDGIVHDHEESRGVYVVPAVNFEASGTWGAEIEVSGEGADSSLIGGFTFEVRERAFTPAVGDEAPRSLTPTGVTAAELAAICTRQPPDDMHQTSIDAALDSGRPFVAVFASPSFCQTRLCGPVTELVLSLRSQFEGQVAFIHVEPFDLHLLQNEGRLELASPAQEWGLPTEPWVFVVDADGRVAAKFESLFGAEELTAAVERMLQTEAQSSLGDD